jgi:two-component system LytT family response regulator
MTSLRVLIADDEELARRRLTRLLSALPDVELLGECASGAEVLARVAQGGVELLLLDVRMPGLTGLEAMELLPRPMREPGGAPLVVFCTAHDDQAVRAFEAGAVDYLLKPVEAARLQKALQRARERLQPARKTPLAISTQQGLQLIAPDDVSHAVLDGELVTLVTREGREVLTDFSLQDLAERLPPERFERVHRRALLDLAQVARLEPLPSGGFLAHTRSGHVVEVSRQAARVLRRRLGLRRAPQDEGE